MGSRARNDGTQNMHFIRKTINFNDGAAITGIKLGTLPQGAFINSVTTEVVTAFNAATTNVLTAGDLTTTTQLVGTADVTEGTPGVYASPAASLGRSLAASGDVDIYAKYTQTGTAATTGQAVITIAYAPNNDG